MTAASGVLAPEQTAFLVRQRVARLATADAAGRPHAVPVCFAYSPGALYIALDEKPKGASGPVPLLLTLVAGDRAVETQVSLDGGGQPR